MINGHGGNIYETAQRLGCEPSDIIDMSSNVNPLGPPPGLTDFLKEKMNVITALPQAGAEKAISAFARRYNVSPNLVLSGNGTTQLIHTVPQALGTRKACILAPTYSDYGDACAMHHVPCEYLIAEASSDFKHDMGQIQKKTEGADTVFICNPNNPTGVLIPADELRWLCSTYPNKYFIIDESYLPFVHEADHYTMLNCGLPNVVVLNSMSKIFRVPGLRIGFLVSSEKIIKKFMRYALPWSVNSLAQAAVIYMMEKQAETDMFVQKTRIFLETQRKQIGKAFENASEIKFFPSVTSFMLARLSENFMADEICAQLSQERILIRNCENFKGLSNRFIRISLKTQEINSRLTEKLATALVSVP
ncbi:pyridoxal phosphate-dependent aminotransferase [Desulfonema magnum]|uniref:Threonine-phosphate decarboxylase, CobD-like n=1 Tax=Desulfonema magnum TaxID=45655 RepID=A0A975BK58_9BACT|nr:threonine-phosphate decarboxylase [Desulfonema magnum]QTA86915.1 Putative threonine-phosphate decarboxylase, CobD-like [Desulfonema magnum]